MKFLHIIMLSSMLLPQVATAGDIVPKGRELAGQSFGNLDLDNRGFVDMGQFLTQGTNVFVSMDANDDNALTLDEFLGWDFGFKEIAEEKDRVQAYETARKVVFAFWDGNGDGAITPTEHQKSLISDFQRADLNNDAFVSKEEYLNGFTINVALRSALKD